MSDENDKTEEAITNDESEGPVCGERLAEARRKLQISVVDIAKELHLDDYKVRALESNDFEVIGAPVFAKGHLKKYAQLVKVDEADVMADYYQLERESGMPPVVPKRSRPRQMISPGPWIATIVVIAIAASGYWWFTTRETPPARPVTGEIAPLPQEADSAVAEVDETELPGQGVTIEPELDADSAPESESEPESELAPEFAPEPVALPLVETDVLEISITYSGDCWTEITDASGRRLFFDLGKSGRTINLTGEAPFNALFGDAANVSLVVNGASFDIPARDRRGRTARLTITGT
jgi:cytoskeleton protein RodZ